MGCMLVCLSVGGMYLGVNFIISHNYEGVKTVLSDADRSKHVKRDWAFEQVETSSTVGGRALGFLHGGLNYQVTESRCCLVGRAHPLGRRPSPDDIFAVHAVCPRVSPRVSGACSSGNGEPVANNGRLGLRFGHGR